MSSSASPFSPRIVLAVLAIGAAALLLLLYAIGAGWDGRSERNGGAHAAANGLNGFAGLVRLLEAQGHEVSLSRSEARLADEALLVLTPPPNADGEHIAQIIADRRYFGPTIVILPKWIALPAEQVRTLNAPRGWVVLAGTTAPEWIGELDGLEGTVASIVRRTTWQGMGRKGELAQPEAVLELSATLLVPLVRSEGQRVLAGYVFDGGVYARLAAAAGRPPKDAKGADDALWPVVIVAEPDLMNNYGLADRTRAELAHAIIDAALEGSDLPIVFDLTAAGLGRGENLLTLAFTPPFLAATLSLLLAALVIAWRGMLRFGPPVTEAPEQAKGKRQLARNGAALVERARRLHLLGPTYAALVTTRIAEVLGVRVPDPQAREAAVAQALAARGLSDDYATHAEALRRARHSADLLRAAGALKAIERTLAP